MKICIDPGHGGHDSGAVGPAGTLEKDVVLTVAAKLSYFITPRHNVFLTHSTDVFRTLRGRAHFANDNNCDLFLSIHANAGGGRGFEAFTSRGQSNSDAWATKFLNDYHEDFPNRPYRKDLQDGDPDKEASFTVLVATSMPAVLFEIGFIDHVEEEQWMVNNTVSIARALAKPLVPQTELSPPPPVNDARIDHAVEKLKAARVLLEQAQGLIVEGGSNERHLRHDPERKT